MDDQVCPKCKTTRYRNPSMKLMVNDCGHNLCDSCVDLLFVKGSGSCPECQIPLRRVNFRVQLFDDALVDREVDIRRRVLRDYNRKADDFNTLREYNDYLESVEDIIFNLNNDIEVSETQQRINEYKEKNRDSIARNRHRLSKECLELEDILHYEKTQSVSKAREMEELEASHKLEKQRVKEQMIQELMFSETNAEDIVDSFNSSTKAVTAASVSKFHVPGAPDPVHNPNAPPTRPECLSNAPPEIITDEPYVYSEPLYAFEGPRPPPIGKELEEYVKHVRPAGPPEIAAGYVESIACYRALQEAMAGLYYAPD